MRRVRSDVRLAVLAAHDHICHYCGGAANEVDHIVSPLHGGNDEPTNLIAACKPCNTTKNARLLPAEEMAAALAKAAATATQINSTPGDSKRRLKPMAKRGFRAAYISLHSAAKEAKR